MIIDEEIKQSYAQRFPDAAVSTEEEFTVGWVLLYWKEAPVQLQVRCCRGLSKKLGGSSLGCFLVRENVVMNSLKLSVSKSKAQQPPYKSSQQRTPTDTTTHTHARTYAHEGTREGGGGEGSQGEGDETRPFQPNYNETIAVLPQISSVSPPHPRRPLSR